MNSYFVTSLTFQNSRLKYYQHFTRSVSLIPQAKHVRFWRFFFYYVICKCKDQSTNLKLICFFGGDPNFNWCVVKKLFHRNTRCPIPNVNKLSMDPRTCFSSPIYNQPYSAIKCIRKRVPWIRSEFNFGVMSQIFIETTAICWMWKSRVITLGIQRQRTFYDFLYPKYQQCKISWDFLP